MTIRIDQLYARLFDHFGPQHWWPGQSPFEVIVGAVLTQNTSWINVRRAIDRLREADLLDPQAMYDLDLDELAELIRPAGYYRLKARRLNNLLALVIEQYGGSLERMFSVDMPSLREALLSVNGVGPQTADSILLYAAEMPSFVVDTYTHRILARHGMIGFDADYHQIKSFFEDTIEPDVARYNEFHALLVRVGHAHCRRKPKCDGCPLEALLPGGEPCTPDF